MQPMNIEQILQKEIGESKRWLEIEKDDSITSEIFQKQIQSPANHLFPCIYNLEYDWGFESRLEYKNLNEMTKRITSTSEMKTTKVATSKNFSMWLHDTKLENK